MRGFRAILADGEASAVEEGEHFSLESGRAVEVRRACQAQKSQAAIARDWDVAMRAVMPGAPDQSPGDDDSDGESKGKPPQRRGPPRPRRRRPPRPRHPSWGKQTGAEIAAEWDEIMAVFAGIAPENDCSE
jgi:hypothetical protein